MLMLTVSLIRWLSWLQITTLPLVRADFFTRAALPGMAFFDFHHVMLSQFKGACQP